MYYGELQEIFGRMPFGLRNYWSGRFLRELPDDLIKLSVARFRAEDVRGSILLEPLFGAAKRVPPDATAFAGREASFNATFISSWVDPSDDDRSIEVARRYSSELAPWQIGGGYINYASESTGDGMETEYGAARVERLRKIKRHYDPDNRFRFNHNIAPG
jgi:FAD/FMN-containing dehydrogenase